MAAVVLVCWSVALAICWHHCATGACSGNSKVAAKAQPSCHSVPDNSDPGKSNPNDAGSACFAKKPFSGEKLIVNAAAPSLHLGYLSAALNLVAFELPRASQSFHLRQATPRDWVFTPEVSLGPAFHSLAPPALS